MTRKITTTTLTTSGTSSNISISNTGNNMNYITSGYSSTITKYHILGEDFENNGYLDGTTAVMISTLNVLGKPFYDELKKNNVSFPDDMDKFIQERLKVLDRDKKIDSIIKDNP